MNKKKQAKMIVIAKKYARVMWRMRFNHKNKTEQHAMIRVGDTAWTAEMTMVKSCFNYYLKYHHAGKVSSDTRIRWGQS